MWHSACLQHAVQVRRMFPGERNDSSKGFVIFLLTVSCLTAPPVTAGVETTRLSNTCLTLEEIISRMTAADSERRDGLEEYSAVRKYTLHNDRKVKTAEMLVRATYRKGSGKSFEIVSSQGAEGMSGRVLHRLMDAEAEASKKDTRDQSRVIPRNYDFEFLGKEMRDGRLCYLLQITPKTKSKYLLNGKVWVDTDDFGIVRLEGRPTANVSFWVGKPYVVMDFEKVGDFWLISHNQSRADCKFIGAMELTIEYSGYQVMGSQSLAKARRTYNSSLE